MSRGAECDPFVGICWGTQKFEAYRFGSTGEQIDCLVQASGVAGLDRAAMADTMAMLADQWPDAGPVYACGMIGSNIGWIEVPYVAAPAGFAVLATASMTVELGNTRVAILPGVACRRHFDGSPDVMRGEEIDLLGSAADGTADSYAVLAGTHAKWARLENGKITEFFTSMAGEIYARLTSEGLLASVVDGDAADGPAFLAGVTVGLSRALSLATLLFGVRARVVRGDLNRADAASYAQGLLIGSEIADAMALFPELAKASVTLLGGNRPAVLLASALAHCGIATTTLDGSRARRQGFLGIHRAIAR